MKYSYVFLFKILTSGYIHLVGHQLMHEKEGSFSSVKC